MKSTFLIAAACAATAVATAQIPAVRWLPSASPEAQYAVYTGDGSERVCRARVDSVNYAGSLMERGCVVRLGVNDIIQQTYEVPVGFAKWDFPDSTTANPVISGTVQGRNLEVCRVHTGSGWRAGSRLNGDTFCTIPQQGNVAAPNFETLYANNLSEKYQLVWPGNGLCAGIRSAGGVVETALCRDLNPLQWLLLQDVSGNFQFVTAGGTAPSCLTLPDGSVAILGPCQQANSLFRLRPIDDTTYRLVSASGLALSMSSDSIEEGVRMVPKPIGNTPLQRFEVLARSDGARKLSVLSYNMMLLIGAYLPGMRSADRAVYIVQAIQRDRTRPDVITISEAFDPIAFEYLKTLLAAAGYPYFTQRPYDFWNAGKGLGTGGVFIASRWPIDSEDNFTFSVGTGLDAASSKGVSYGRVNKMGQYFHVFATHLQSGSFPTQRFVQLVEMGNWVRGKVGANTQRQPVIMAGDFNIDMETNPGEYQLMLDTLTATFAFAPRPVGWFLPGPGQPRYTTNPATNLIANKRGAEAEWLDYILVSRSVPARSASYRVIEYKHTNDYTMFLEHTGQIPHPATFRDLSDHSALLARFRF